MENKLLLIRGLTGRDVITHITIAYARVCTDVVRHIVKIIYDRIITCTDGRSYTIAYSYELFIAFVPICTTWDMGLQRKFGRTEVVYSSTELLWLNHHHIHKYIMGYNHIRTIMCARVSAHQTSIGNIIAIRSTYPSSMESDAPCLFPF